MDIPNNLNNEIELGVPNDEIESKQQSPHSNQASVVDHDQIITVIEDEVKDQHHNTEWNKYKLMTWNLWCIPVSSPRCLSNPDRCASYLLDIAEKQEWQNYDGLIVLGIQELWCWKTGIFPPFLLRIIALFEYIPYIGRFFAALFTIISLLFGALPILKCLPIQYDPKGRFMHKLRHYLPFAMKNSAIPIASFLDNGLCILTNKPPTKWGFERYDASACDDSLANKGWLWCYYEAQKLMIINTHMQAAGPGHERLLQIKELKGWLYRNWESDGLINKCVVLGDFNVDMESHPERLQIFNETQQKLEPAINNEPRILSIEDSSEAQSQESNINDAVLAVPTSNDSNSDVVAMPSITATVSTTTTSSNANIINEDLINANNTEIGHKIQQDINKELGDDPLTCLSCSGKDSLADNLRKIRLAKHNKTRGKKAKYTKKAYINIPHHLGDKYHKLNPYKPTFKRAEYNIDHIFANFECKQIENDLLALGRYQLSDHRLVISEFTT